MQRTAKSDSFKKWPSLVSLSCGWFCFKYKALNAVLSPWFELIITFRTKHILFSREHNVLRKYYVHVRVHPSALVKFMFQKKIYVFSNMPWPFLEYPIDEEAALLCRDLQRCDKIILRLQQVGLSFYFWFLHNLSAHHQNHLLWTCPHILADSLYSPIVFSRRKLFFCTTSAMGNTFVSLLSSEL